MTQDTGNQDAVQWGPEIVVDGRRPEWLKDEGQQLLHKDSENDYWFGESVRWEIGELTEARWRTTSTIRLPANHPYYATLKQEEKPGPTPAQVARMKALVRRIAEGPESPWSTEARAIVAELDPVDGDLVEACRIKDSLYYNNDPEWRDDLDTTRAYKLILRGRESQKRGEG